MEEPLGQTHAAEIKAVVEAKPGRPPDDKLGRAAADVDHERVVGARSPRRGAPEGQLRLLVPREQPRLKAVAPFDLTEERLAVLGVANGAGGDRENPLGAELLGLAPEVGENVPNAGNRQGEEAMALVDALAEACDLLPPRDLFEPSVVHIGDEEPSGIGT